MQMWWTQNGRQWWCFSPTVQRPRHPSCRHFLGPPMSERPASPFTYTVYGVAPFLWDSLPGSPQPFPLGNHREHPALSRKLPGIERKQWCFGHKTMSQHFGTAALIEVWGCRVRMEGYLQVAQVVEFGCVPTSAHAKDHGCPPFPQSVPEAAFPS